MTHLERMQKREDIYEKITQTISLDEWTFIVNEVDRLEEALTRIARLVPKGRVSIQPQKTLEHALHIAREEIEK